MFNNFKNRILNRLRFELQWNNTIVTTPDSKFGEGVYIKGAFIRGRVNLAEGCRIMDGVRILADSVVSVGRYASLNGPNMDIVSKFHPVTIGAFTSIARNVTIQEFNHRIDLPTTSRIHYHFFDHDNYKDEHSKGPIEIGNDVWIGTHSVVLTGSKIGDGAIVGANSVVSDEIPPYAIAVGSPARVVGFRFSPEIVGCLLDLRWWEWPVEKIRANADFFSSLPTTENLAKLN
jgi:virginiamycin A acetyltransferase